MKSNEEVYLCIVIAVNIVASYAAFVVAPTEKSMGEVYRIFYIHTPSAWVCYLTLGISLLASILFLAKRKVTYDALAEVSAILGLIYGAVAIVTGAIWSNAVWGAYWNWDPRQTTTLVLWMAYMGYVSLKLSIGNVEKRALVGAVYNILAFSTIPLSYLSIRLWQSLHPQIITPSKITITAPMIETLFLNLIAASLVYVYLLRMMLHVQSLEDRVEVLIYEKGGATRGT
jgi:heme exporter protein C